MQLFTHFGEGTLQPVLLSLSQPIFNFVEPCCKIWTTKLIYDTKPHVHLKVYPNPANFTQPLDAMVVTYCISVAETCSEGKDKRNDELINIVRGG